MLPSRDPARGPSFHDELEAAELAELIQCDYAAHVGGSRTQLFRHFVVDPITKLADRWVEAWERFAHALRGPGLAPPAAAIKAVDRILGDLHRVAQTADAELTCWHTRQAETFHKHYPNGGSFSRMWNTRADHPLIGHWVLRWCNADQSPYPTPATTFGRLATWIRQQIPQRQWTRSELLQPLRTVALVALLGTDASLKAFGRALLHQNRCELAAVWPVLAAMVLPPPGLLERFFQSNPSPNEVTLAWRLVRWSESVIGKSLESEFQSLVAESQVPKSAHVIALAVPAKAEPAVQPSIQPTEAAACFAPVVPQESVLLPQPAATRSVQDWEALAAGLLVTRREVITTLSDLHKIMTEDGYPYTLQTLYKMKKLIATATAAGIYKPTRQRDRLPRRGHKSDGRIEAYEEN